MDSKKANRRKFLKGGAAIAAAGAIQTATGQSQAPATRSLKDLVPYGERSRFIKSIRVAVAERPSPDDGFALPEWKHAMPRPFPNKP